MNTVTARDRGEWRAWLAANHADVSEIWLLYYKKNTGIPSVAYGESVEEALCYGWIDSIIKKLDDEKYARKFTPRKDNSQWSVSNINRVEKMIKAGLMTEYGLQKVNAAKQSGNWDTPVQAPKLTFEIHPDFAHALDQNLTAQENFGLMPASYQKEYLGWIEVAKQPDTRARRIKEALRLLEQNKKLGLR